MNTTKNIKTIELVSQPSRFHRASTVWIIRCVETGEQLSSSTSEAEERARMDYFTENEFSSVRYVAK